MKRVPKPNRADAAYEHLKGEILGNRLPAGFQATEPDVAEGLNMSRTPVREALVRLKDDGLIDLIPRHGVRVLPVSPDDMREIYQILTALEPEAAAGVAESGLSDAQYAELEAATSDMQRGLDAGDLDAWAAADDRFHRTLLSYSANKRMAAILNRLFDQAHRARMVTLRLREPPAQSTDEHRAILEAMRSGNARKTRSVFRAHRERAAKELGGLLDRIRLTQL